MDVASLASAAFFGMRDAEAAPAADAMNGWIDMVWICSSALRRGIVEKAWVCVRQMMPTATKAMSAFMVCLVRW